MEEVREYQKAVEYLCGLIKAGELKIGSKLPTERKLAETLSIGRNSTREALRILENMGVIVCRQGSGNYLAGYDSIMEILSADLRSQSLEQQIEADRKFHYMLIQAAENPLWICISEAIITIYRNWIDHVLRAADLDLKQRLQQAHLLLLMALKEGSRDLCDQAVDHHYDLVDNKMSEISDVL